MTPVDDVIKKVECVISWAMDTQSPLGYFAALYLRVTKSIRGAILANKFEDGLRMVEFDAEFAGRYLNAVIAHWDPVGKPTRVWQSGFKTRDGHKPLTILQYLLTAMNAHIDLDLAVVTAEIYRKSPDKSWESLHHDFIAVNTILATQIPGVLDAIDKVSPVFSTYRKLLYNNDIDFINTALCTFRDNAWGFARELVDAPTAEQAQLIHDRDAACFDFGSAYVHPVFPFGDMFDAIRAKESTDIRHNIEVLQGVAAHPAALPRNLW